MHTKAVLPSIGRDHRPNQTTLRKETCSLHGGLGCFLGSDTDGSVICADGYRDSDIKYNSSCYMSRPKVVAFSITDSSGVEVKDNLIEDSSECKLHLTVKNSSSVSIRNIQVFFDTTKTRWVMGDGPNFISEYGIADFYLYCNMLGVSHPNPTKVRYRIICDNCEEITGKLTDKH